MLPVGREVESQASPTQTNSTHTEAHGALPVKEPGHSGPERLARVPGRKPALGPGWPVRFPPSLSHHGSMAGRIK